MAGMEKMEWHQTPANQANLFDTIPPIPLQSLPEARSPQLRCHQLPVTHTQKQTLYAALKIW